MEYTYKVRIYPTKEQENLIQRTFGCCRYVFNHFLAERIAAYQQTGKSPTRFDQDKSLTALRQQLPWLQEVECWSLHRAIKNLDNAYKNFFRRVKKGETPGFPKFKSKKTSRKSYTSCGQHITIVDDRIRFPKLEWVKCKMSKPIQGRILSATISQEPSGKYFAALCCVDVDIAPLPSTGKEIGVDMGLRSLAIASDGTKYENPEHMEKSLKRLARLQRQLSRKTKGSHRYEKARIKIARLHEHIANQRNDSLHKLSTKLVRENDLIAIEDLDVTSMLKEKILSRRISDVAWHELRRQLEYKAAWYGKQVIAVDRYFPSTQICSVCGARHPSITKPLPKTWTCPDCGTVHDIDVNAAVNILAEGLKASA